MKTELLEVARKKLKALLVAGRKTEVKYWEPRMTGPSLLAEVRKMSKDIELHPNLKVLELVIRKSQKLRKMGPV